MGLPKIYQAGEKCPPIPSFIAYYFKKHILRFEIIMYDSIVSEKPDSIGDSMYEHDFGF